mmetsp:Transcript_25128/g.44810  ORF Transcript_25128/g.44810 Transcript_25128/m.44810 type:complete len:209 (-) Transcript_25128:1593-2219(-)
MLILLHAGLNKLLLQEVNPLSLNEMRCEIVQYAEPVQHGCACISVPASLAVIDWLSKLFPELFWITEVVRTNPTDHDVILVEVVLQRVSSKRETALRLYQLYCFVLVRRPSPKFMRLICNNYAWRVDQQLLYLPLGLCCLSLFLQHQCGKFVVGYHKHSAGLLTPLPDLWSNLCATFEKGIRLYALAFANPMLELLLPIGKHVGRQHD